MAGSYIIESRQYCQIIADILKVKQGSALNFSAYVEGPAGKYSKVIMI
jgi:hypothetical protein